MNPDSRIHVLSCNRVIHTKPYRSSGSVMQHFLFRLQVEGSSIATLNGKSYPMASRNLIICRPGDDYRLYIGPVEPDNPDAPMHSVDYYIRCSGDWIDRWSRPGDPSLLHVGTDERIVGLFHSLMQERRNVMEQDANILDHWMRLLLLHLRRLIDRSSSTAADPFAHIPYKMKAFIEKNATEPLTLEAISASVGLGKSRASDLFRQTFGQSVVDYAIQVRLSIARERMLVEGLSLEEVAYSCGFHTYSHFSRTFSARCGMSPRTYRQRHI